jgi:plasmid stabilization system protein ParE
MNSYRVVLTDEAQSDLDDIFDYILFESENQTVAEPFAIQLIHTIKEALSFMPARHPIYKNQVRRFIFPKHTTSFASFILSGIS